MLPGKLCYVGDTHLHLHMLFKFPCSKQVSEVHSTKSNHVKMVSVKVNSLGETYCQSFRACGNEIGKSATVLFNEKRGKLYRKRACV